MKIEERKNLSRFLPGLVSEKWTSQTQTEPLIAKIRAKIQIEMKEFTKHSITIHQTIKIHYSCLFKYRTYQKIDPPSHGYNLKSHYISDNMEKQ